MEQNQVESKKDKQNKEKIVVIGIIAVSVFFGIIGMTVKGLNSSSSYRKNTNSNYLTSNNSSYYGGSSNNSYSSSSSSYGGNSSYSSKSNSSYSGSSSSSSKKSNSSSSYKSSNPADYDSKGNYKPVNTMTQKEIKKELEEIVKDNLYNKVK
ncbi:MAG: hypothetical protein HFJ34_06580 [Clostridia bacterium]|nr:hypothetical protein [Clostridia bacterium]